MLYIIKSFKIDITFFLSVPFRREIKPEKMDVLLTLLGNIIEGLERDELRKIAYPTQNRYKIYYK